LNIRNNDTPDVSLFLLIFPAFSPPGGINPGSTAFDDLKT